MVNNMVNIYDELTIKLLFQVKMVLFAVDVGNGWYLSSSSLAKGRIGRTGRMDRIKFTKKFRYAQQADGLYAAREDATVHFAEVLSFLR